MTTVSDSELAAVWTDPDAWVTASEAHRLVATETLSHEAHVAIATRASAGLLRARAELMLIGRTQRHSDVEVPAGFWWARGDLALNQNWEVGDFDTWFDKRVHYQVFGVRFLRADLERMLPRLGKTSRTAPEPSRERGGRPPSPLWPDWVAELVALIHEEGVPEGSGSTGADALIDRVADRLAVRGKETPARTTLLPTARAVLSRMRSDGN